MAGHFYNAYNVSFAGGTVTVTSSTAAATSFAITDPSPYDLDSNGDHVLGNQTQGGATFYTTKSVDGVARNTSATPPNPGNWTYLGTVTINGVIGFLGQSGTNYVFFQNSVASAPPANSTGSLIAASTDPLHQNGNWDATTASQYLPCFVDGTRIATPAGLIEVERLTAGDTVLTASGKVATIRWVGRSAVSRVFADPVRVLPVCIKAGALAENLPVADLYVSPGHALVLDGLLVQAGALVNGTTIVRDTEAAVVFTYYHIELENHDVLLAEGVPTESFLDGVEDLDFVNLADRPAREVAMTELAMPRVKSPRQVPQALRARIAERAALLSPAVAIAA